ncbi:MAG: Ferritin-like protein [Candidatus Krumholzibacteriota bacterium]|nr:Ferritin-like protein [Candidatus Krumholzibacteriota bacterium]
MIPKKIEAAMNKQINHELYSSYLYLSMSTYFMGLNLEGFAHWMRVQAKEELAHGIKFYDHILERGGTPKLDAIKAPEAAWKSPLEVCQAVVKHEQLISKNINALADLSLAEKDHASLTLLHWFVNEQVEEEANATLLAERVKMIKESAGGLLMLDRQLAKREG